MPQREIERKFLLKDCDIVTIIHLIIEELEYKDAKDSEKHYIPQWIESLMEKEVTKDKKYLHSYIATKGKLKD